MIDRKTYEKRIEALSAQAQLAFSAASVERLLPVFERRSGETWGVPHNLVAMAWSAIEGEDIGHTRWLRMRDFLQRLHVFIDDWGPEHGATNDVVAAALMLCENYDVRPSGDTKLDKKERARRAVSIAFNAHSAIQALQRESLDIDPLIEFACNGENERLWHHAALTKLEENGEQHPTRVFFDDVEDAEMKTGRGLDGSQACWFPWDRVIPIPGPDLTLYAGGFVAKPKVVYSISAVKKKQQEDGSQVLDAEVFTILECAPKDGVARFSYHVLNSDLRAWSYFLIYHIIAGELLFHDLGSRCKEIRFRDLDTDVRTLVPYPAHALADND